MSDGADNVDRFFKPCVDCGKPVHARAKACKACGAASPWHPQPDAPVVEYICVEPFACMVGVSLREFQSGEILNDGELIRYLLKQDCPIKPREDNETAIICPHCQKSFLPSQGEKAEYSPEVLAKLQHLGLA